MPGIKNRGCLVLLWWTCCLLIKMQSAAAGPNNADSLKKMRSSAKSDTAKIRLRYMTGLAGNVRRTSYWDSLVKDVQKHTPATKNTL